MEKIIFYWELQLWMLLIGENLWDIDGTTPQPTVTNEFTNPNKSAQWVTNDAKIINWFLIQTTRQDGSNCYLTYQYTPI